MKHHLGHVLAVEDNELTRILLQSSLKDICDVTFAGTAAEAEARARETHFDLVLMDVVLPDGDGFVVSERIRTQALNKTVPVVFLTSKGEREDKLKGFSLGAVDYIVKPFDVVEFQMRIAAKLRSYNEHAQASDVIRKGPLEVRQTTQKIIVAEDGQTRTLDLTGNQYKILIYLLKNEGRTITRGEILSQVWGEGVHVSDRTIDTHIYSIRQELGPFAKCVRSAHGEGYAFDSEPRSSKRRAA